MREAIRDRSDEARLGFDRLSSTKRPATRRWLIPALELSSLCIAVAGCAATPPGLSVHPPPGPVVLAESQLDSVTAGTSSATIDLVALARGTTASTSTAARLNSVQAMILLLGSNPRRLTQQMVDITYGSGTAEAEGDIEARCSATPRIDGLTLYASTTSTQITKPSLAVCSCALISISPVH